MVKSTSTKARSTTSRETANNKSSSSQKRQPNSASGSHQPRLEATISTKKFLRRRSDERPEGRWEYGVELVAPAMDFWGLEL
jgi:hypothetical protein